MCYPSKTAFHSKRTQETIIPKYNTTIFAYQLHKTSTTTKDTPAVRRELNNFK